MSDQAKAVTPVGEVIGPDPRHFWEPAGDIPLSMNYMLAFLHSEDGRTTWLATRSAYRGTTRNLWIFEDKGGDHLTYLEKAATAYRGTLDAGIRHGRWGLWRPDGGSVMTCVDRSLVWDDGELIHLEGEAIGGATRCAIRGGEPPMVTTVRPLRVSGTVDGERAQGLLLHQSFHLPGGASLFQTPYLDELQITWVIFVTELEDGTIQAGEMVYGRGGFSYLLVQRSDGPPLFTTDVTAEIETDGHDVAYPSRARYSGGGEHWIWEATGNGDRWPVRDDLPEGHRIRLGSVRREDDPRAVVRSGGFMEAYVTRI